MSSSLPAWAVLESHHREIRDRHLRELFAQDPSRFPRLTLEACGLFLDYSKNRITDETLERLLDLAREVDLEAWTGRLFAGEAVNSTEGRAALHMALRYRGEGPFPSAERDVMPGVRDVLARMHAFAAAVRGGTWRGYTGRPIRHVVNIGIGGSDLGPAMVTRALSAYAHKGLSAHFVSNLDATQLAEVLRACRPEETLFIVASKTFSTQETLTNARSARAWLMDHAGDDSAVAKHFVAVSTQRDRVAAFGIDPANMFEFWDWVGGRYSLWSAIGLSIATSIGMERFEELLAGAHAMDEHFRTAPLHRNMPVLLGLLGVWYRNFFHAPTHAVLAYDYALRDLAAHLQQLEMESNGKRVTREGMVVDYATCPILWGGLGNNGQHAFYQLLHQGTALVPSDFIVPARTRHALPEHEEAMLSNALAQTEALMHGRTAEEARAALRAKGSGGAVLEAQLAHRVLPGNQPTNTIVYERLTPQVLGALIALYEHKVFVQSVCWGVNAFDQWGVELGKELARSILPELTAEGEVIAHDASTNGLINRIKRMRGAKAP
ncbi:MAG: glucose-6-phosphate isomerase [Gammaproteobacteria bacterium]|nr:glucose-6-phosphate isomerase [Gammaproteobacteria bacterium]NIR85265.1 glucose-6-phosphate isomerase [Gammaproteobacteria bacterium]NIR88381.1 glucose-6-phosphate isomerase [Gammaproteobacteria bacterium]NIU06331.1 glucose-6-phosphate isomerase [Gammaproteobacteria bacterium]NIV53230.1 glucose-6-phosphate isomerase [Gammaproteobacteria bacterium]